MNHETIIKLAKAAGFWGVDAWFAANAERFARFADAVAQHEREQCATVVEHAMTDQYIGNTEGDALN